MANNAEVTLKFKVTTDGSLQLISKELQKTAKTAKEADKAQEKYNYTLNQGVVGTSSAARSFSKLNQVIGEGPNGLVGAYATLAANAFAVSAAFNVLKEAAQVEQLLKGLEIQGARTGKTLTTVAASVKELSGASLSSAEAMRAVAQASTSGISTTDIERLTQVATASSRALGRDVPDSLNRLILAVTKAEPELVDELGLTIKLTEAFDMYARQTGKTADGLSRLEKQQALINAWASQGEVKFGALADAVDPNPYDQLAASFKDLTTTVLNFLNNSGLLALVSFFATNKLALTGAILLFVSTIKETLLPVLTDAAKSAKDFASERVATLKTEQDALTKVQGSLAKHTKANEEMLASLGDVKTLPKHYAKWVELEREGADATNEHARAMKSLEASRTRYKGLAEKALEGGDTQKFDYYADMMTKREADIANLETYATRKSAIEVGMAAANAEARQVQIRTRIEESAVQAQGSRADAIEALSKGNLRQAYASLMISSKAYKQQLTQEIILKAELSGITNAAAVAQTNLNRTMIAARVAMFGLATGIKAVGSALLTALPYLALVVFGIELISMAWDAIKPEAWKKQEKAFEDLSEVVNSTNQKFQSYNDIQNKTGEVTQKSEALLINRTNTLSEALNAYDKYSKAIASASKEEAKAAANLNRLAFEVGYLGSGVAVANYIWTRWADSTNKELGIPLDSLTYRIFQITAASSESEKATASLLASMEKGLPATTKEFIELNKSFEGMNEEQRKSTIQEWAAGLQPAMQVARDAVDELSSSLSALTNDWADFIRSIGTTTPYDKLMGSIDSTANSITKFRTQMASGIIDPKDADAMLAQISEASARLPASILGEEGLKIRDTIQASDDALVRLRANQSKFQEGTKQYASIQESIKSLENDRLGLAQKLGTEVDKNLVTLQASVYQSQLDSITAQGNLALAQARLGVIQRQGKISAEDVAREIDAKNRIVQLQVAQIKANRAYLDMEVSKKQLELDSAVRRAEEIEALIERNRLEGDNLKFNLELAKLRIQDEKQTSKTAERIADINRQLGILSQAGNNTENLKTLKEQAEQNAESARKARDLAQAMLTANDAQAAAAAMSAVTAAEKAYEQAKIDLANRKEKYALEKAIEDTKLDQYKQSRQLLDIENSGLGSASRRFEILKEEFRLRRQDEQKQFEFKRDELALEIAKATAENRSQAVEILIERRKLLEQENVLRAANLPVEEKLAIYAEIDLDTNEKKLELLSKSLEVYSKQAEQQQTILEKEQELLKLRLKNNRSLAAAPMGQTAEKAVEFRALTAQLNLAKEQLELKKVGIRLEYAILEAQKQLLLDKLRANKAEASILAAKAAPGSPERLAAENIVSVLDTSIKTLAASSYDALRENAIRIADMDIKILEERAKQGYNEIIGSFLQEVLGKNNPAFSLLGAIQDTATIIENLKAGKSIEQATTRLPPGVQEQVKALETNSGAISNLTTAINNLTTAANSPATTVTPPTPAAAPATAPTSTDTAKAAAEGVAEGVKKETPELIRQVMRLQPWQSSFPQRSGFGERTHPITGEKRMHHGRDFAYPEGTPIRAQEAGVVGFVGSLRGYGNVIDLYVGEMENGVKVFRRFAHLMESAVKAGDRLEPGALLGRTGSTGLSTGPHLHEEVRVGRAGAGTAINPLDRPSITGYGEAPAVTENEDIVVTGAKTTTESVRTEAQMWSDIIKNARAEIAGTADDIKLNFVESLAAISPTINNMTEQLKTLGPQGEAAAAIGQGFMTIATSFGTTMQTINESYTDYSTKMIEKFMEDGEITTKEIASMQGQAEHTAGKMAAVFSAASAAIGAVSSMLQANSQARIANIDKEIAAEQKRDGKSAASVAKIEAMEKKKDSIARKQFNTNKKLQLAQAVMATAAGIAGVLSQTAIYGPILTPILAGMIGAMGLAQVAIISGTSYESASTSKAASTPSSVSIGKRSDSVNLAAGPNANAGGEVGYLRGAQGTGSNASNFRTIGSAYGGELMRGYGNRGFVVGEKGPEVLSPETPINVTPANEVQGGQPINASFNIQALDASGVQDILVAQKGNIIKMLREASNASGKSFMEDVNVNVYTRPSIGKL